jgi:tRNA-specific 2-thiouridylase
MNKKIMVAMSGGVDSSVAALLLKQKGYDVSGATMKLLKNKDYMYCDGTDNKSCCALSDVFDARNVSSQLAINYYVFDLSNFFYENVIKRFVEGYLSAETPNPCIDCNRYVKFQKLLSRAMCLGYDFIATGHYAQVYFDETLHKFILKKAVDTSKDQTYFLYMLTQKELSKIIFPLGMLLKKEVRKIAQENNLINAKKHESQDICFVKNKTYRMFLDSFIKKYNYKVCSGNFIDTSGKVIGQHCGIANYTIGQRKGISLNINKPMYVIAKNKFDNTITVGEEPELYKKYLIARDINLIYIDKKRLECDYFFVTAKIRYNALEVAAKIKFIDHDRLFVAFKEPQKAITPGQIIVFYEKDKVFGGGIIDSSS